jgi:serine protease AprX
MAVNGGVWPRPGSRTGAGSRVTGSEAVLAVLLALLLLASPFAVRQQEARARGADAKIAPWVWSRTEAGQQAEFLIVLDGQADLSGAASLATKAAKGEFVHDALLAIARRAQKGLLSELTTRGVEHRAFYIVNAVWVRGDRQLALDLAARPEVERVEGNPEVQAVDQTPTGQGAEREDAAATLAAAPSAAGANIAYVRAPEVWAMGFTGQGIVVGGQDTGYDWDHPALLAQYRGWNGITVTHDYNWHDAIHAGSSANACGVDLLAPCDDQAHGTHTMGTAVGSDGGANQIGMAPGAKWIGCRNMDAGIGTPARYLECFEFFLAPYPVGGGSADGDPALAPDVTVNSWSCPSSEGCGWQTLQGAVDAQQAAGILTVAAAGNRGPGCNSISDPPGIYASAYTIGALNTGTDSVAGFSGRGPVAVDGSNRGKPDLTAPGTGVYSSVPGGGYESFGWNGTSMATPHVAGAAALLWSARPPLRNSLLDTINVLNWSAVPITVTSCSSGGAPNNLYGYGRLDVRAAVDHAVIRKSYLPLVIRGGP